MSDPDQDQAFHQMDQEQQMHTMEQERADRDADPAIIDKMEGRGYSLATLQEVAGHLAWHTFNEGELNQINRLAMILAAVVRSRHALRRSEEKAKRFAEQPKQPAGELTRETVYPGKGPYVGD